MIPAGQEGYSLKKWCLKQWIYSHGYTQPYVARRLGVSALSRLHTTVCSKKARRIRRGVQEKITRTREVQRVSDKLSCRAYESKGSLSSSVFPDVGNEASNL